jgi:hypothetical protein
MRNTRCSGVATAGFRGVFQVHSRNLPDALPAVPNALGNQRPVGGSLEIRALPALLSPGVDHLERPLLPSAALDDPAAEIGCDSVPMRVMPLQLCELSALQRKVFVAEECAGSGRGYSAESGDGHSRDGNSRLIVWWTYSAPHARLPAAPWSAHQESTQRPARGASLRV